MPMKSQSQNHLKYRAGEIFNGDPFSYEEKFPAFQTGLRW